MRPNLTLRHTRRVIPAFTAALIAAGVLTNLQAQVQTAGTLFVEVDATSLAEGPITSIPNTGDLGGVFAASGPETDIPVVGTIGGTKGILFDGTDFLQHLDQVGGNMVYAPEGLVGPDPTRSIEVWAYNPELAQEESMVSWGKRESGDGVNVSFNYGSDFRWGAVGHFGNRDIGWNNQGGGPQPGKWHHLVYTYDGTTTRVYADGELMNAEYLGLGAINTAFDSAIVLGAQTRADGFTIEPGNKLSGAIGRVRVHNEVLTPEQILNNYNTERAAFIDPPDPVDPEPIAHERLPAEPIHRYSFNEAAGDATNLTIEDSVGDAEGMVLGAGATFTGSRLVLPGGSSQTAAYGDLPNGLLSSHSVANGGTGEFTIETWVKLTGSHSWSRVWDFGSSGFFDDISGQFVEEEYFGPGGTGIGQDFLFYTAQIGGDVNNRRLGLKNINIDSVTTDLFFDHTTSTFNTDTHLVLTWDEATGQVIMYENGVQIGTLTTPAQMSDINDINVWLGRSNFTPDANAQGEYDEVRIYDYVLTQGQVLGNIGAGPNALNNADIPVTIVAQPQSVTVPEASAVTLRVTASGSSLISYQWLRNGTEIEGATSASYTIPTANAADNGAAYTVRISNLINGEPVSVTSEPAILTVESPEVTMEHRYSFNETEGTDVIDSVSGANGSVIGFADFADGQLTLDGSTYVDLPNGIISGLGADGTIEMWITHQSVGIWSRIFDFGTGNLGEDPVDASSGEDFLFLTSRTPDGFPRFIANFPGGGDLVTLDPAPPGSLPPEERHVVVTWSASGNTSRLYWDGELVATGTAPRPLSDLAGRDVNNWLARSQWSADQWWGGKFNELRIHSGAMTPSQVQASFAAGPDGTAVEAPAIATAVTGENLVISWPASATGFALEGSPALGDDAVWTAVGGATTNGDQIEVTIPLEGEARFFRLRQ